ncbi:MAG: 3-deoxy-D-manno-octulosonic acid transferase [Alphaproteobacteria bacterium]|nr:3-deoxy-D-manno-octulosonic acid transferase [Alphaproteobacteria bacterium]
MIIHLYSLLGWLLTPLLWFWLKRRTKRGKEEASRLGERFGATRIRRPEGKLIWLHAASVGETQSVFTLIDKLLAQHAKLHILVTTGTLTSAQMIKAKNLPRVIHQYLPSDVPLACKRFMRQWRPDLALWVESELWPQMLQQIAQQKLPLMLINGRMSPRAYTRWTRWPKLAKHMLNCFDMMFVMSEEDGARYRLLGAKKVRYVGNLKYDADALMAEANSLAQLGEQLANRPAWVAASTHPGEEMQLIHTHTQVKRLYPEVLTIIIPRHAHRGKAITAELRAAGLQVAQRSEGEPITANTDIYLADTMGELGLFFRLSDIVFLGGSLVAHGGHNPLEPARLNCALLTGEHTHNFAAVMEALRAQRAIQVVHDNDMLARAIVKLLADDEARLGMAERALDVVMASQGAAETIVLHINHILHERSSYAHAA